MCVVFFLSFSTESIRLLYSDRVIIHALYIERDKCTAKILYHLFVCKVFISMFFLLLNAEQKKRIYYEEVQPLTLINTIPCNYYTCWVDKQSTGVSDTYGSFVHYACLYYINTNVCVCVCVCWSVNAHLQLGI